MFKNINFISGFKFKIVRISVYRLKVLYNLSHVIYTTSGIHLSALLGMFECIFHFYEFLLCSRRIVM